MNNNMTMYYVGFKALEELNKILQGKATEAMLLSVSSNLLKLLATEQ